MQDAIDEIKNANKIDYDGTLSGLSATEVQGAIDEVVDSKSTVTIESFTGTTDSNGWLYLTASTNKTIVGVLGRGGQYGLVRYQSGTGDNLVIQMVGFDAINVVWSVLRNTTVTISIIYATV